MQDFWVHLAAMLAIGVGLADLWHFHSFARDSDLVFIVGGFAGMGLKILNGSAAMFRNAALDTAYAASRTATAAAASATSAAASAAAATETK